LSPTLFFPFAYNAGKKIVAVKSLRPIPVYI